MKIIKNYLYNAGYQILLMIAPILTTPYVSRVLGPHNNGINTYTNGWVTFFYLLGQLGISIYGNREIAYKRENKYERSKVFWEIAILQLITSATSLLIYLFVVFLFSTTFKLYFILQALWIIAYGIDISWYFMGLEDFKKTVTRNTIIKIISIFLIFLLVKDKNDLSKYIFLIGFSQLLGSISLWPYLKNSIEWVSLKNINPFQHFLPTILLFIPTITTQIYVIVNRIMLGRMASQGATAQFDFGDRIVKLVLAIVTATGTVMLPHIANKFASGEIKAVKESLYKSFEFVTSLSIPMMLGLMAISDKFAPWFLGNEYILTGKIIYLEAPIILLIAWSNVTGLQYLMPTHKEHEYTISVTAGAIVNIIANLVLISLWKANGAAIATVISEAIVLLIQLNFIKNELDLKEMFSSSWKYFLSGLVMYIAIDTLNSILVMNFLNLIVEAVIGIIIYVSLIYILKAPIIITALNILKNGESMGEN